MTLHRVTVAAFTALLLISGIGTLMARQGPPSLVPPVELSDDAAETPPAVGGEVEEVAAAPDLTDARATAPPAEPTEVLVTTETVVEEALPADALSDVAAPDADDDDGSDDDDEGDSDDDDEDD